MKREYSNQNHNINTNFFIGTEVEHTPTHKKRTLFIVGVQPVKDILLIMKHKSCEVLYFGANMSFNPQSDDEFNEWVAMVNEALHSSNDLVCTLDFDVKYAEQIATSILTQHRNFVPMISVKIPEVLRMGYNATVKIDDKTFDYSNPGVWSHSLIDLMDRTKFTNWNDYKGDEII